MNAQHKCLFHSNNAIIKFCQDSTNLSISGQCTLPLCIECEPIHINQHNQKRSEAKILRFNEATLKASNEMQDYLQNYKRYVREQKNKIENDREIVVNMIDQYYNAAYSMLEKIKENAGKIQEHFNKLKKGSIKTLIFYYSGDIKIDKLDMDFQPLQNKVRKLLQNKQQKAQVPQKKLDKIYQVSSIQQQDKKYGSNLSEASNVQERVKIQKNIQSEHENIFCNIQQIKQGRSRQRARKSIFDQNKKGSAVLSPHETHQKIQTKYSYKHQEIQVREDSNSLVQPSPKFHYEPPQEYKYKYQKTFEPQAPLSFENRFLNKFTVGQKERENINKYQEIVKREPPRYEFKKYEEQTYTLNSKVNKHSDQSYTVNNKILKPSDLEIEKQNIGKETHSNYMLSQRNRSLSQNHFSDKEVKKSNYDFDLKKQVLSPDQIRKMLEKKIEERNRILSIKKSDNYQPPAEEKGKRGWETRDSIINQIYTDTRQ